MKRNLSGLFTVCLGLLTMAACGGGSGGASAGSGSAGSSSSSSIASSGPPAGYTLIWADEFSTDGLPDLGNWSYDTGANATGWYNNEKQYYSNARLENSSISGGILSITARKENLSSMPDFGGQAYSSARLYSAGKREFTYGFFEIRAKMPCGQGTWPAVWMLGKSGTWPQQGETDILEHVGSNPQIVQSALHMGAHYGGAAIVKTHRLTDACSEFHNYQLLWTAQSMIFYVDGVAYHQYDNDGTGNTNTWPYSQPQFLILNLAIGGDLGGAIDDTIFPRSFQIDYVRVYQKS